MEPLLLPGMHTLLFFHLEYPHHKRFPGYIPSAISPTLPQLPKRVPKQML